MYGTAKFHLGLGFEAENAAEDATKPFDALPLAHGRRVPTDQARISQMQWQLLGFS
jgi:hypothetical protein